MNKKDISKNELRQCSIDKRNSLNLANKIQLDEAVYSILKTFPLYHFADKVLLYYSLPREVNTLAITDDCLQAGKTVCFPVCLPNRQMAFMPVNHLEDLQQGSFGIPEPTYDVNNLILPDENTLCVVPALAVDRHGNRLGYGGGYYDRWLAVHKVTTVALCYEMNLEHEIPAEEFDIPVDFIITENRCVSIHPKLSFGKEVK